MTVHYRGYEIEKSLTSFDGTYMVSDPRGVHLSTHDRLKDAKAWVDGEVHIKFEHLDERADDINRRIESLTGEPSHVRAYVTDTVQGLTLGDLEAILDCVTALRDSRDQWKAHVFEAAYSN